uniref:Latrophilin Cirl n=1 Tax=Bursaphelenchus xylophilus TaxID=6326 RepID=A0A1I7RVW5_BURXY
MSSFGRWNSRNFLIFLTFLLISGLNADDNVILEVCEGELAHLACPQEDTVISVLIANFGRFALNTCNPTFREGLNTLCGNDRTKPILDELCSGQNSCNFTASAKLFGDACPDTPKYIEVQYSCIPATTTAAPTTTPAPGEEAAPEDYDGSGVRNSDKVGYTVTNPHSLDHPHLQEVQNTACAAEYDSVRLLQWPQIKRNELAKAACPVDYKGVAKRRCNDNGFWERNADLSECVSDAIIKFKDDNEQYFAADSLVPAFIHQELKSLVTSSLVAGDLVKISLLLERIQLHNSRNDVSLNREELSDTAKDTIQTVNGVLGMRIAWLDLPYELQRSTAYRLLRTIQRTLNNAAKSVPFPDTIRAPFVARPYVIGAISVLRPISDIEFPYLERFDVEDRALFGLMEEARRLEDSFEIAYSSVANLAPFIVQPHHHLTEGNPEREDCSRTVISNIISTYAARRTHSSQKSPILTEIPMVLSFSTKKSANFPYPYCAKFDQDAEDFVYDQNCEMLVHNETKTICRCKGVGHFAVISSTCEVKVSVCAVPALITALSAALCGNFHMALQGRQKLWTPPLWNCLSPLLVIIIVQSVFVITIVALLCKHRRVGYEPCRNDAGKVRAVRKTLYQTAPFLLIVNFLVSATYMFVTKWTAPCMWTVVIANSILAIYTLKSFLIKGQTSFCRKSKNFGATDFPKDSIFSPAVQARGSVPNIHCCEPNYSTKSTSIVQYMEDGPKTMAIPDFHALHCQTQAYVATQGGVHDAHYCDHTYATIPADYCGFYAQHYQQNPVQYHSAQLPPYPPPPAPDSYGCQMQNYAAYFQHPGQRMMCMHECHPPPSPICNEHGHRCPSLVGLRTPSQLQHKPSSASASNVSSGSPYESARSSSTATGSQFSNSTQGTTTALLRMDMSRNMPVFFDENSS